MNRSVYRLLLKSSLAVSVALLLGSCGGNTSSSDPAAADTIPPADTGATVETYFQVPLPGELFSTLRKMGVKPRSGLVNPAENLSKYSGSTEKALNFGVYSSDLFYCSTFDQKADVLKYFENLRKLSDELGISSVVTEQTLRRIEKNLGNNDSLNRITEDVFYDASASLEKNGQGATLALIIAGGIAESLYIATHITGAENKTALHHIADQKFPLENLFQFFDQHSTDGRVSKVKNMMEEVRQVFESIPTENAELAASQKGGRVIGGETRLAITANDFNRLKEAAAKLRNNFTATSSSN